MGTYPIPIHGGNQQELVNMLTLLTKDDEGGVKLGVVEILTYELKDAIEWAAQWPI